MPRLHLTDLAIQKLRLGDKQVTYWDTAMPAFGVRVSTRSKSFVTMYGKERRLKTLGKYPGMSLKAARIACIEFLDDSPARPSNRYPEAVERFLEAQSRRLKVETVKQYRRFLEKMSFEKSLGEITRADLDEKLSYYNGKPFAQNYAYATMRGFLNWCIDQGYIDTHPLVRGRTPNKLPTRTRVLSDAELARVWRATSDDAYGRMVRVMILTGQRRMEVRNLTPEDVNDGLITFHTKGDRENVIPLTPLVEENLVLPYRFNNWSQSLAKLCGEANVECTHHDLRRTLATNLARLRVDDIVIERVLGHTVENVKFTYNRYSYLPEVKAALLRYENHIRHITGA